MNQSLRLKQSVQFLVCAVLALSTSLVSVLAQEELEFAATHGDGGSACGGVGMCRNIMLLRSTPSNTAPAESDQMTAQTQLSMVGGELFLSLHNILSKKNLRSNDVRTFPLSTDADVPSDKARKLGFSAIHLYRGSYSAVASGVFPIHARYSFGLGIAPNPTSFPARIRFEALQPLNASVYIFDRVGNRIATVVENEKHTAASRIVERFWDGKTSSGSAAARGAYIVELRVTLPRGGSFAETTTLVIE